MSAFFLQIVNMSISASWIVLAVLLLRLLLKKAPKWIIVLLWGIVAVRLICPFTIESVMSLIPSAETISPQVLIAKPEIHTGFSTLNSTINPIIQSATVTVAPEKSISTLKLFVLIFSRVWIVGVGGMFLYAVISYIQLKRKIGTAILLRDNIYQTENAASAFALGIVKPRIYIPLYVNEQDIPHVIVHEQAHIRRKDHWWKPLGFLLLALHWFNPLMWLGYVLLCRDIELACDEKVIKEWNTEQKADYSQALLNCSVNRRVITACPLAFGEVGVADRVKSVLHYKKPAFWLIAVAIVVSIVTAICFLTNPASDYDSDLEIFLEKQILEHHHGSYRRGEFYCADYKVLGTKKDNGNITVYMWALYSEYDKVDGAIEDISGGNTPTVITVKKVKADEKYELVEYWEPGAGSYFGPYLQEKFPWYLYIKLLLMEEGPIKELRENCDKKAQEYFDSAGLRASVFGTGEPLNVITAADVEPLKTKFPNYFDLPTSEGLSVYIWQMAEDSYSCGLLPNGAATQKQLWDLHKTPASLDEMRAIIACYIVNLSVTKSDIGIHAITMPHSSYAYMIDDAYRQTLTELFWSDIPLVAHVIYRTMDAASFDIDNDGKDEKCTLSYGPTSGLFTIVLSAFENGELEYFNMYNLEHGEISFAATVDGTKLRHVSQGSATPIDYSFSVEGGNIVLSAGDQTVAYWSEQGVDSEYAHYYHIPG